MTASELFWYLLAVNGIMVLALGIELHRRGLVGLLQWLSVRLAAWSRAIETMIHSYRHWRDRYQNDAEKEREATFSNRDFTVA